MMTWKLAFFQQVVFFLAFNLYFLCLYTSDQLQERFPGLTNRLLFLIGFCWIFIGAIVRKTAIEVTFFTGYWGLINAFMKQLILFVVCMIYWVWRDSYLPPEKKFKVPYKGFIPMILVIWFVFGTWYRYITQMPLLGVWGYLMQNS